MTKKVIRILLVLILVYLGLCYVFNHYYSKSISLSPLPPEKVVYCNSGKADRNSSIVRILVIDGGGIDGIMPLVLLNYLEEKTGKPISDLFDFFTGTSTGSIIVSTLNMPDQHGKPKYTAKEILDLYRTVSKKVLNASWLRRIFTIRGYVAPHLSIQTLHQGFTKFLGQATFGQLIKKVAITAYDITDKQLKVFNSWDCDQTITRYTTADIITVAAATPTYFSPAVLNDYTHHEPSVFVDGMIFANNPSLKAIEEAFTLYPHAKKFIIVHLGTGGNSIDFLHLSGEKIQRWGVLNWIYPMMSILYKSQNTVIKDALINIQNFSCSTKFEYHYFTKPLAVASPFDTSPENIQNIEKTAEALLLEKKQDLDAVAAALLAN